MASFTTIISEQNNPQVNEYHRSFLQLQALNREICNNTSHAKLLTRKNIENSAVPERQRTVSINANIDVKLRNKLLLQMTTISVLARTTVERAECADIIEQLIKADNLPLSLMDYALSDDKYVSYMSMQCLLHLLNMYPEETPKHWQMVLYQDIIATIISYQSFSRLDLVFALSHKILNRNKNIAFQCHVVTTVGSCWRFFFTHVMDIVKEFSKSHDAMRNKLKMQTTVAFLRLWKRIVKSKSQILTNLHDDNVSETSPKYIPPETHDDFLKLSPKLLDMMWLSKMAYMIQNRVMDVLNSVLTYHSSNKREKSHIATLAKIVIAAINKDLFTGIDFHRHITFGWSKIAPKVRNVVHGEVINKYKRCNKFMLRKATLLACNAAKETVDASVTYMNKVIFALEKTSALGNSFREIELRHSSGLLFWIKDVFNEQDDDWIQVLLSLLNITIDQRQVSYIPRPDRRDIEIHLLFHDFCETIKYDSTLLLDLIVSPETLFLLFFTKYLKFLIADWDTEDSIAYSEDFSGLEASGKFAPEKREHKRAEGVWHTMRPMQHSDEDLDFGEDHDAIVEENAAEGSYYSYYYTGTGYTDDLEGLPDLNQDQDGFFSQGTLDENTTDPSFSSTQISYHEIDDDLQQQTSFLMGTRENTENVMFMFARLMSCLQKMQDSHVLMFNVTPIIKLLYKIQKRKPHVLSGYIKLVRRRDTHP